MLTQRHAKLPVPMCILACQPLLDPTKLIAALEEKIKGSPKLRTSLKGMMCFTMWWDLPHLYSK